MTSNEIAIEVEGPLREDLIRTAVTFLNNANVRASSAVQKESFLKRKGLTSEEIKTAFERSNNELKALSYVPEAQLPQHMQRSVALTSWFQRLRDILNTIALFFGVSYAVYYLYERFIAPLIFKRSKKPKSVETTVNEVKETVTKSISELKTGVEQVQSELERVVVVAQNEQQNYIKEISQLKSEVATVKGILLNRHQFPSVSLSTTSIPAWQLTSSGHKDDKEILESEDAEHNSGSSETEIVQASNRNGGSQGSDSSLEMIKEVDG